MATNKVSLYLNDFTFFKHSQRAECRFLFGQKVVCFCHFNGDNGCCSVWHLVSYLEICWFSIFVRATNLLNDYIMVDYVRRF